MNPPNSIFVSDQQTQRGLQVQSRLALLCNYAVAASLSPDPRSLEADRLAVEASTTSRPPAVCQGICLAAFVSHSAGDSFIQLHLFILRTLLFETFLVNPLELSRALLPLSILPLCTFVQWHNRSHDSLFHSHAATSDDETCSSSIIYPHSAPSNSTST